MFTADLVQRTEATGCKRKIRGPVLSGSLRSRELELPMRVVPGFSLAEGPSAFSGMRWKLAQTAAPARGSGLSVALFVVLKPAPRRGVSHPPTGARMPGALGRINVRRVWKQLSPTELQPAPQLGSKSSSLAHFFAIAKWLVYFFSSQNPPLAHCLGISLS